MTQMAARVGARCWVERGAAWSVLARAPGLVTSPEQQKAVAAPTEAAAGATMVTREKAAVEAGVRRGQ